MRYSKLSFAILSILVSSIGSNALAHAPYFGERKHMVHFELGPLEFAVLYGDGNFTADPSQVTVFDSESSLIAATPLSNSLIIRCEQSGSKPSCSAYDPLRGMVFEPDYSQWFKGEKINEAGRPLSDAYPELMNMNMASQVALRN